jgi:ankyrin repeat protein
MDGPVREVGARSGGGVHFAVDDEALLRGGWAAWALAWGLAQRGDSPTCVAKVMAALSDVPSAARETAVRCVLRIAVANHRLGIVHALLQAWPESATVPCGGVDGTVPSCLWTAARYDCAEAARALVSAKASVDGAAPTLALASAMGTPAAAAVMHGSVQVLTTLLDANANVRASVPWAGSMLGYAAARGMLGCAAAQGNDCMVDALIAANANVDAADASGSTPMCAAAQAGQVGSLERLMRAKAGVAAQDSRQRTALWYASDWCHADAVGLLVQAKAPVNVPDVRGERPLGMAASAGHCNPKAAHRTVQVLLAAKAHVNVAAGSATPLHHAARLNRCAVARSLLAARAGPNTSNGVRGNTPLRWSICSPLPDAAMLLVYSKADLGASCGMDGGWTLADLARQRWRKFPAALAVLGLLSGGVHGPGCAAGTRVLDSDPSSVARCVADDVQPLFTNDEQWEEWVFVGTQGTSDPIFAEEDGREGGREDGREGGREDGREGGREDEGDEDEGEGTGTVLRQQGGGEDSGPVTKRARSIK